MTDRVERWRRGGEQVDVEGRSLFVHRTAGDGPPLLLLHGFPSSSYDWRQLIARLPAGRSVLAFDFLGFGFSDKPRGRDYSLFEQADLTEELVSGWADGPVQVVAHDMGTSVVTELLARDIEGKLPFDLGSVLLFNGSMIVERASLTLGQRLLRSPLGPLFAQLSTKRFFSQQFSGLFSPSHPLEQDELDDQWALWTRAGGQRNAHRLIGYVGERMHYADRWHGALRDWPGDLAFAWGMLDPVATPNVLAGLRELRPNAPVTELPDLGHYPQIEAPDVIAGIVASPSPA